MNLIKILKRFNFKKLKPFDIVIYDENEKEKFLSLFPSNKSIYIIKSRPSDLYINLYFNYKLLENIIFYKKNISRLNKRNFLINIVTFLRDMRIKTIIQLVRPSLLFTFIDNQSRLGRVVNTYYPNINYITIQNSIKRSWEFSPICNHDKYFAFSKTEVEKIKNMGWRFNKIYSNGSFRAAQILKDKELSFNVCRDILVVSGWRGNIEIDEDYLKQIEAMKNMNKMLFNYVNQRKIKLSILTRTIKNDEHWFVPYYKMSEEDFIKSIYGTNVEIIQNRKKGSLLYEEAAKSKISIGSLSSAIYELSLYGFDAFYLNLHKSDKYHKDFPNEISYKIDSQNKLNTILDSKLNKEFKLNFIKKESNKKAINNLQFLKKVINENLKD